MDHREITISSIPRTPQHNSLAAIIQWYLICYLGMDPDHKIAHLWKKRMDRYAKNAYQIRKTTLAMELAQQMEKPKAELPQPYVDFRDVFEKKTIDKLSHREPLIMPLNSTKDSPQKWPKSTHSTPRNKKLAECLLMNISSPGRSFHPSPHKYHYSSLYQRRMDL